MDRRKAIKNLAIVSGGLITLPQWMVSCGVSDTTIHQTSFSIAEQKILASVTDTIIPAGNPIAIGSIGALSVGVDKFLQKLIDDCYEKDVQDNIKTQLKSLDLTAKATSKKSFADCTQAQREELLLKFFSSEKKEEKDFAALVKSETIRGFNTSQKVMREYLGYKVAPGHYYGCIDVKESNHA
ncbi:MAG TPA: gluconate 2-dehydrogenase subunit 3 family protein [Chitinophagaceae bacterium]|nr:gluconate 2-dehydrogenase subunit 3 family protein [Chitinophagaceae bacterium]